MKSIVLLSGGLDSAVVLAQVRNTVGGEIHTLTVDYGQRHRRELWSAFQIARYYGATHEVLTLPGKLLTGSALTGGEGETEGAATVVPGRNLVLVSLAVACAVAHDAPEVWIGSNASDREIYPDCRPAFLDSLSSAASAGYGVAIIAPLAHKTKRQVVALGRRLAVPFDLTWSCYDPEDYDSLAPASGRPCGKCGACKVRAEAMA